MLQYFQYRINTGLFAKNHLSFQQRPGFWFGITERLFRRNEKPYPAGYFFRSEMCFQERGLAIRFNFHQKLKDHLFLVAAKLEKPETMVIRNAVFAKPQMFRRQFNDM